VLTMNGKNKGFSILEYSLLVAVFIAAIVGMQVYLKRAVQGRLKSATDSVGRQFSPALSNYSYTRTFSSKRQELITPQGVATSTLLEPEKVITSSYTDDFSDKKLTGEGLFE
jgi:Flp pilus assembly pilin Flp